MTVSEIVDELRATRPRASEPLRIQVLTTASQPVVAAPTLLARIRGRRAFLLVPAAATLAVASAVAIGVTRPEPAVREAATPAATTQPESQEFGRSGDASVGGVPGVADSAAQLAAPKAAPPGTTSGRATRYAANLTLAVEDSEALSEATQRALAIARDLGGYVVAVHYTTGDEGLASVTLRVPSARSGDAVTRLSALGRIVAQDVQIEDLQQPLDELDRTLRRLRTQLAAVKAKLEGSLTSDERARLEARRVQLKAELDRLAANRAATAAEARLATFQLELRTEENEGVAAPSSRLDRALDKALAVLTWEAVVALAIAVASAPLVLAGLLLWIARRAQRRRADDRLLAAS